MQQTLPIASQILQALAILVLGLGIGMLALMLKRMKTSLDRLDGAVGRIAEGAGPVLDRARAVGENVNYIVMSVRKNVDEASRTVTRANVRVEEALTAAEGRVRELDAVIGVLQNEVEETLLSAGSALRGFRAGAEMLASRKAPGGSRDGDDGRSARSG